MRRQSRDTNRNIKMKRFGVGPIRIVLFNVSSTAPSSEINRLFLSDEEPMLETLDYAIRIGRTPNLFIFWLVYLYGYFLRSVFFYKKSIRSNKQPSSSHFRVRIRFTYNAITYCIYNAMPLTRVVLMARTPPQLTSAEPSETFHSTKHSIPLNWPMTSRVPDFRNLPFGI